MLWEKLDFVVITGFRRLWQSRPRLWLDPSPPRETVGDGKVPVVTLSAPVRLSRRGNREATAPDLSAGPYPAPLIAVQAIENRQLLGIEPPGRDAVGPPPIEALLTPLTSCASDARAWPCRNVKWRRRPRLARRAETSGFSPGATFQRRRDFARFDFARKARRPDGSEVDVAFSLAFAASPALPEAGFFVCQQRFPENFWSRAAQVHPNGASGIAGIAIAHENPREAADFLARFCDAPAPRRQGPAWIVEAEGARVECAPRAALADRYGAAIAREGPAFALARIAVADLARMRERLASNGVAFEPRGEGLIAPAMGAALAFEAARAPGGR